MSEIQTQATTAKRPPTEYTEVSMLDGRKVSFAGKRRMVKEILVDEAAGKTTVRFDFVNGDTRSISSDQLSRYNALYALGHGLAQKCGDTIAGMKEESTDELVLEVEEMIKQVTGGNWNAQREAGDSFAGASIVIKAICEVSGKSVVDVKTFLQGKLDAATAAGKKLTRQALYASFRAPGTKTAAVIKRMEEDRLAKGAAVDANELLGEIGV